MAWDFKDEKPVYDESGQDEKDRLMYNGLLRKDFPHLSDETLHIFRGLPRKGQTYLSGAIPEAYRAINDVSTYHWIVSNPDVLKEIKE